MLLPLAGFSQNIIPHIHISENIESSDTNTYKQFKIKFSPGYQDHGFKIEILNQDSTFVTQAEINFKLIIHKKNFKLDDSKKEYWDYETEIKSNDIWNDNIIEVGDCSNNKYLFVLIRLKLPEKYIIKTYHTEYRLYEYLHGWVL